MANDSLDERLAKLYAKKDHIDQFHDVDLRTIIDAIRDAREHGGTASVDITPISGGGGYKITITDSDGVAHNAEIRDGGDAYTVYESTVPEGQTPMSKTEWLASLKGADGHDGAPGNNGHNPCLGRFNVLPTLSPNPFGDARDGDYIYLDTTDPETSDPVTYIYHFDGTNWDAHGTVVDVSNETFGSGQSVPGTYIKDLDGNNDPNAAGVLSAKAGKELADITTEIVVSENILNPNEIVLNKRIKPDGTEADNGTTTANYIYGCTTYIELPDEGMTLNHGVTLIGAFAYGAIVYNSAHVKIGGKSTVSKGIPLFVSPTNYTEEAAQGVEDLTPKYVRFNLYKPETPYDGTNDGYAIYKGSTLPSSFIPYFSPRREMKQQEIKDGAVTTEKIADSAVTVDKISETEYIPVTDNICNPEECVFDGKYIVADTGKVSASSSTVYSGYTGYIPIDERGVYCNGSKQGGRAIGYAYYSEMNESSYIDGYYKDHHPEGCTQNYAAYVVGAKYVRFSIGTGYDATNIMANIGSKELPYVAYGGTKKVISPDILPTSPSTKEDIKTYEQGVSIVLPSDIYCTKGDTLYLYWRSFIEAINPKVFDCCSPNDQVVKNILSYPDCLKITKTEDTPFKVVVRDNALNEVARKTVNFNAVDVPTISPASEVNILFVGASREANGVTPLEVYRRLVGDNTMSPAGLGLTNINFVGRKGCSHDKCEQLGYPSSLYSQVKHEAVSGRWIQYMVEEGKLTGYTFYFEPNQDYVFNQDDKYTDGTRVYTVVGSDPAAGDLQVIISSGDGTPSATGRLTLTKGSGTATVDYTSYENETSNPFWNSSTNKIDFAKYSNDNCDGATITILILSRGLNDLFNRRTPDAIVKNFATVIDAFHEYNPNGYVIINLGVLPSMYGGLQHSYNKGTALTTTWYAAKKTLELHKLLIELGESDDYKDFCLLSNSSAEFDLDYFYSKKATTIRNRGTSKTVDYDGNALHFSEIGKQVVADSIYHCVCKIINDINGQS